MITNGTEIADIDEAVRTHLPIVGHIVRETLMRVPAHVNRDDLTSAGLAALAAAARSYSPERGVPFAKFAALRIRGALVDELRSLDWASRSVRVRSRRLEDTRHDLATQLGRTPTASEVAQTLGVAESEIHALEGDVQRSVVLSLQGFAPGTAEDMAPDPAAGPEELLLHRERLGFLRQAVDALPEKLRLVVTEYFLNERPMAEIAAALGVSESRVSQLRGEALALLKDGINSQLAPEMVLPPAKPEGVVARRRQDYYDAIAGAGDLRSRLSHTDEHATVLRAA